MENKLFKIGIIANTFGIKGVLKLLLDDYIAFNDNIENLDLIFCKSGSKFIPMKIEVSKAKNHNTLLLQAVGISDINIASKYKGLEVFISNQTSFFFQEIKLTYYQVCDQENKFYLVIDVMSNGVHDLIKVSDNIEKPFWIPMVDAYVIKIDDIDQTIFVQNIGGLK